MAMVKEMTINFPTWRKLSANPDLTAWRVKEILESTAKDLGPKGKDNDTGHGLLNALASVKAAVAEKKKE